MRDGGSGGVKTKASERRRCGMFASFPAWRSWTVGDVDHGEGVVKRLCRVTNWSNHDRALLCQGKLTICFEDASVLGPWALSSPERCSKPVPLCLGREKNPARAARSNRGWVSRRSRPMAPTTTPAATWRLPNGTPGPPSRPATERFRRETIAPATPSSRKSRPGDLPNSFENSRLRSIGIGFVVVEDEGNVFDDQSKALLAHQRLSENRQVVKVFYKILWDV